MIKVGIIGYDLGNQDSLFYVLKSIGFKVIISKNKEILSKSDILVLPGVGSFPLAMKLLRKNNLTEFLVNWSNKNKPILGICLGMQLLCSEGYEFEKCKGLDIIRGEIIPLEQKNWHIGWNSNLIVRNNFLDEQKDESYYYNHSYKYNGDSKFIISNSIFNNEIIPSIIKKGNTLGIQFHPEKSQESGKKLILNIIKKLING